MKILKNLTKKDLKIIAEKVADIKVYFYNNRKTKLVNEDSRNYINLDFIELQGQDSQDKLKRGHKVREFALMVLLHEIGHYKHSKKFGTIDNFTHNYKVNKHYFEKLADRFARRYYKKILESYNSFNSNKLRRKKDWVRT